MIYVIEGLDRCGKTTFINYLTKHIKNPKLLNIHSVKPPVGVDPSRWSSEYYDILIDTILKLHNENFDVIMDRSWIGEAVYGPLYRNVSIGLDKLEEKLDYVQRFFKLFLFIDTPENISLRDDGLSISNKIEDLEKEIELFNTAFDNTKITEKYLIDWSQVKYDNHYLDEFAKQVTL
jgi:thymidylate kinase